MVYTTLWWFGGLFIIVYPHYKHIVSSIFPFYSYFDPSPDVGCRRIHSCACPMLRRRRFLKISAVAVAVDHWHVRGDQNQVVSLDKIIINKTKNNNTTTNNNNNYYIYIHPQTWEHVETARLISYQQLRCNSTHDIFGHKAIKLVNVSTTQDIPSGNLT